MKGARGSCALSPFFLGPGLPTTSPALATSLTSHNPPLSPYSPKPVTPRHKPTSFERTSLTSSHPDLPPNPFAWLPHPQLEHRGLLLKNVLLLVLLLDTAASGQGVGLPAGTPPLFERTAAHKSSKQVGGMNGADRSRGVVCAAVG